MAEVYYVDLLALLRAFKDGMKNVTLYGRIVKQSEYPSVLRPGVATTDNGAFVIMEVFAANLNYYSSYLRSYGVMNKDGIYMVNGTVIAYVDGVVKKNPPDWYQISGTLRLPSGKTGSNCVAMFNFFRDGKAWALRPCRVDDLDINQWEKHSDPFAWINASDDAGCIKHPPEVLNLPRFEHFDRSATTQPRPVQQQPQSEPMPEPPMSQVNVAIRNFPKDNRQEIKDCGDTYVSYKSVLDKAEEAKYVFTAALTAQYDPKDCPDSYLRYMLNGISTNFTRRRSNYALTGRGLIKKYLETNPQAGQSYLGARSAADYLVDIFQECRSFILDHSTVVNAEGVALNLCRDMFGDQERFYAGIVGVVLGLSAETVSELVQQCKNFNLSIIKIFNENPYILQFLGTLSFDEIENIAMCFGRHEDQSLSKYRNTAMLNAYISDTSDGSTVYRVSKMANANIGVRLTRARYEKVRQGASYLSEAMAINIDSYIRSTARIPLTYMPNGFRQISGGAYLRGLSQAEIKQAIADYVGTGLGVVKDDYLTSSTLLKKELFVFNTMKTLASKTFQYKREDIDKCISEYEELAGFKLESSQVKAVHLLTNGAFVVAGSAGSGKTTVSKCVVYTLRKLSPELEIKFAAPTGKAAKRMQEVVHEECRTLHSMFHLSTASENLFDQEETANASSNVAYFFDEGAMITVDLMYRVLRNVDTGSTRVCLFGDFNQLSPIGKGLPFKNLLRFMPCVFLDVVKRAAEGSNITANSMLINEASDYGKWQWLKSGNDFHLLPCGGDRIQGVVQALCNHYLGRVPDNGTLARMLNLDKLPVVEGLTPDDIQVVSPLTKESYHWGATSLNQVLQPLFNPTRGVGKTFIYQTTKFAKPQRFMIGDRVIHTDKNMYSMQWYGSYQGGTFQKIYGQGICNGEVGKVVAFMPADRAEFLKEVEPMPEDFEYMSSLRDDSYHKGQNAYLVVVEYFDFISARNFYICYRAEKNNSVESNEGVVLKGEDVAKLNLFYAGTTHKLQGSQAKLIICVLDDINFGGFITRQMVYTMITRAEKLVFMVGSVGNTKNSMLTRARMDIASVDTLTVGELLV